MESAFIVSCAKESVTLFSEALNVASINQITVLASAGEARRMLLERDVDLVIIEAPLADEDGESLARDIALKGLSQVILAVSGERFNALSAACHEDGVLAISRPVDREKFLIALSLARSVSVKLKRMQDENKKLKQKLEDARVINLAKCLLISYLKLKEHEAHRFIEKQAMDLRSSKRAIAEEIIKTYAN